MADVAGRAGVSVMTVSRVLNGFPGVAEDTRQRVEEAVAALGYRANPAARVLAGGRSRTLGVIAVETQQFGPSHMLYGIEAAARGAGHVLSFVTMAPGADEIGATLDHLRAAHVEGVIVIAPMRPVIDAVADLDADLPLVVVGGDPSVRTSTVTIDQEAGARMATAHLLGLGHRTVHHVSGHPPTGSTPRTGSGRGRRRSRPTAPRRDASSRVTGPPRAAMPPAPSWPRTRR